MALMVLSEFVFFAVYNKHSRITGLLFR